MHRLITRVFGHTFILRSNRLPTPVEIDEYYADMGRVLKQVGNGDGD